MYHKSIFVVAALLSESVQADSKVCRALALSSSGSKAAYEAGVLKGLTNATNGNASAF
jgi:hypothetical protein